MKEGVETKGGVGRERLISLTFIKRGGGGGGRGGIAPIAISVYIIVNIYPKEIAPGAVDVG